MAKIWNRHISEPPRKVNYKPASRKYKRAFYISVAINIYWGVEKLVGMF